MTVDSAAARFTKIYDTLREFRLSNMCFEEGDLYCLVDAMTAQGRSIDDGEEQMKELAAEIVLALDTLSEPASKQEANARLIAASPELLDLVVQYRDDLRHPPSDDSKERRLAAIEAVLTKVTSA